MIETLKSLCVDMGDAGRDNNHGYGLPVLPLTDKLEILETLRKGADVMPFKDIEETRWSKDFIKICVDEGLLRVMRTARLNRHSRSHGKK